MNKLQEWDDLFRYGQGGRHTTAGFKAQVAVVRALAVILHGALGFVIAQTAVQGLGLFSQGDMSGLVPLGVGAILLLALIAYHAWPRDEVWHG